MVIDYLTRSPLLATMAANDGCASGYGSIVVVVVVVFLLLLSPAAAALHSEWEERQSSNPRLARCGIRV